MLGWDSDKPVDRSRDKREGIGRSVEDAEPSAIVGRGVLAGRRQEFLHTSLPVSGLATVVRIVEVHDSVGL
jgi:hypothetical protein